MGQGDGFQRRQVPVKQERKIIFIPTPSAGFNPGFSRGAAPVKSATLLIYFSHRHTRTDTDYYLCRPGRDNGASLRQIAIFADKRRLRNYLFRSLYLSASRHRRDVKLRLVYFAKRCSFSSDKSSERKIPAGKCNRHFTACPCESV